MDVNRPLFAEQSMLEVEECMYQLFHIFCSSLFEQLPAVEQVNTAMSESTETKTRAGGLK